MHNVSQISRKKSGYKLELMKIFDNYYETEKAKTFPEVFSLSFFHKIILLVILSLFSILLKKW